MNHSIESLANIDSVNEKMDNMSINMSHDAEENSNCDPGQSPLTRNNYYEELPHNINNMNHLFHIDFMRSLQDQRSRSATKKSCTFSNEKMRQIERENKILLNKILAQRPRSSVRSAEGPQNAARASSACRISSAAINRRHQQERIDFANNILRKKIEKIAQRSGK